MGKQKPDPRLVEAGRRSSADQFIQPIRSKHQLECILFALTKQDIDKALRLFSMELALVKKFTKKGKLFIIYLSFELYEANKHWIQYVEGIDEFLIHRCWKLLEDEIMLCWEDPMIPFPKWMVERNFVSSRRTTPSPHLIGVKSMATIIKNRPRTRIR